MSQAYSVALHCCRSSLYPSRVPLSLINIRSTGSHRSHSTQLCPSSRLDYINSPLFALPNCLQMKCTICNGKEFFLTYCNCWSCCHFDFFFFFFITSQVWGFIIVSFQLVITRLTKTWTFFFKNCNYVKYDLEPLNLSLRESTAEGVGLSHIWALHLSSSLSPVRDADLWKCLIAHLWTTGWATLRADSYFKFLPGFLSFYTFSSTALLCIFYFVIFCKFSQLTMF